MVRPPSYPFECCLHFLDDVSQQSLACHCGSCDAVLFQAFWHACCRVRLYLLCTLLSGVLNQLPIQAWLVLRSDWPGRWWLFDGAAVSAFFVVIIVALTVLLALRYMLLTRRSLCHPRSSFGRGLMVATGLFAALHFVNVGTHVRRSRSGTCLLKELCPCCALRSSPYGYCIASASVYLV